MYRALPRAQDETRGAGSHAGGMKEICAWVGWIVGIQGGLGLMGPVWGDGPQGLVALWFDPPAAVYVALLVGGLALGIWADGSRKRDKARAAR